MLRTVLLTSAAIALIATAANAGSKVTLSPDHRFVSVTPGKVSLNVPFDAGKKKSKYTYDTFNSDSKGAYFCCFGSTVSGPSSFLGAAYGIAEQFTLKKAASISTLAAAVGYVSGDHNATLTLYADNGSNSPGTAIASGTGSIPTEFGACCGITTASISKTNLSANTPYWVAITAGGSDYNAAPFQVQNEVNSELYEAGTSNGGTTWGQGFQENVEQPAIGVK
jgi:hypothetical protein